MELHELTDGKRVRTPAEESLSINGMLARWLADNNGTLDATGSSNAFAVTTSQGFTEYFDGMTLTFTANHTISGAATFNVNALGEKSLKKNATTDLASGEIVSGQKVKVIYDGTNFQVVGEVTVAQRLVGETIDWPGSTAPTKWLLCGGQAVSRTTYSALFTAISTTYGVGDGSTTFNLPDLRGRVVAGRDDMGGVAAGRLTSFPGALGGAGGAQTHTLTTDELPTGALIVGSGSSIDTAGPGNFGASGGGNAFNIVQPTIFMNKIIYTGVTS